tara:strand:- start:320 stop:427 length:108 start_codon:yes stop_codon:yes gene_type:complete
MRHDQKIKLKTETDLAEASGIADGHTAGALQERKE